LSSSDYLYQSKAVSSFIVYIRGKHTLLGRGFFEGNLLSGCVYYSSAFVSIRPKALTRKHQGYLELDDVSSRVLDRKTNSTLKKFFFSFSSERELKKKLFQAGYGKQKARTK